eukprot:scaffold5797_cov115-Isochrysis_galbana.AAC.5
MSRPSEPRVSRDTSRESPHWPFRVATWFGRAASQDGTASARHILFGHGGNHRFGLFGHVILEPAVPGFLVIRAKLRQHLSLDASVGVWEGDAFGRGTWHRDTMCV